MSSSVANRPRDAVRRVFLQDLLLVFGLGRVPLKEDVRVRIDQTRQQGPAPAVELLHTLGDLVADRGDRPVLDDDHRGIGYVCPGEDSCVRNREPTHSSSLRTVSLSTERSASDCISEYKKSVL